MADFALLESPKLISRKIWVMEKLWIFHTVTHRLKMKDISMFIYISLATDFLPKYYTFFVNTYSYVHLPFASLQQSPLRWKSRGHHTKWAFGGSGHLTWRRSIVIYQTKPRPISWGHQQQPCRSLLILRKASYSQFILRGHYICWSPQKQLRLDDRNWKRRDTGSRRRR